MAELLKTGDLVAYEYRSGKPKVFVKKYDSISSSNLTLVSRGPGWTEMGGYAVNPVPGKRCRVYSKWYDVSTVGNSEDWNWEIVEFYKVEEGSKMKLDIQKGDEVTLLPATVDTVFSNGSMTITWKNNRTMFSITEDQVEKVERPLVLHVGGTAMTVYGSKMVEVRALEGNYAWVKFPDGSYTTRHTHELTPLD